MKVKNKSMISCAKNELKGDEANVNGGVGYGFRVPMNRPGQTDCASEESMDYLEYALESTEVPNYRTAGADTPIVEDELLTSRNTSKTPFSSIYLLEGGEGNEEVFHVGSSVVRDFDNKINNTIGDDGLFDLLPSLLGNYARNLEKTQNLTPLAACASVLFATSAGLGKGVYVETLQERVHPNIYVLNVAASGSGKKAWGKPYEFVRHELGIIEAKSKQACGSVVEMRKKKERELKARAEKVGAADFEADAEYQKFAAEVSELSKLTESRKLACSDDATPQFIARAIVKPGQGGACVISSGEGAMFFERMGGRAKGASGYGTLLTKGFNDPDYILSRVDEGQQTHESTTNPRLVIGISIQNSKIPDALKDLSVGLGYFQRNLYVVGESRSDLPETASLFAEGKCAHPSQIAFKAMVEALTRRCWGVAGYETRLFFEGDAAKLLDTTYKANHALANEIEEDEPVWAEFVARWTEQIIKLVQCFHVASKACPKTGDVDWDKVQEPISRRTLEATIHFHDRWRDETRKFYDQWARPTTCVPGDVSGDEVQKLRDSIFKAMTKNPEVTGGATSGAILQILTTRMGWGIDRVRRVISDNPESFAVNKVGRMTLYLPITNPSDFTPPVKKGAGDAH